MANELTFYFADAASAHQAFDTLQELGYEPQIEKAAAGSRLQIHMCAGDLTSALEISQAHGGLLDEDELGSGAAVYQHAYHVPPGRSIGLTARDDSQQLPLPAHIVTEDFSESYMHPGG